VLRDSGRRLNPWRCRHGHLVSGRLASIPPALTTSAASPVLDGDGQRLSRPDEHHQLLPTGQPGVQQIPSQHGVVLGGQARTEAGANRDRKPAQRHESAARARSS
jgi:hypothetical protein